MDFRFRREETRKRVFFLGETKKERNLILEKWEFKEKKERVWRDFKILRTNLSFGYTNG